VHSDESSDESENEIISDTFNKQKELNLLNNKLKNSLNEINNILNKFSGEIINELNNKKIKLEYMNKNLNDPSIKLLDCEYNKIENNNEILKDNIYILRWNNQDYKIKIL
jgi:hypothetical protein